MFECLRFEYHFEEISHIWVWKKVRLTALFGVSLCVLYECDCVMQLCVYLTL
jgi:hypothetical protein